VPPRSRAGGYDGPPSRPDWSGGEDAETRRVAEAASRRANIDRSGRWSAPPTSYWAGEDAETRRLAEAAKAARPVPAQYQPAPVNSRFGTRFQPIYTEPTVSFGTRDPTMGYNAPKPYSGPSKNQFIDQETVDRRRRQTELQQQNRPSGSFFETLGQALSGEGSSAFKGYEPTPEDLSWFVPGSFVGRGIAALNRGIGSFFLKDLTTMTREKQIDYLRGVAARTTKGNVLEGPGGYTVQGKMSLADTFGYLDPEGQFARDRNNPSNFSNQIKEFGSVSGASRAGSGDERNWDPNYGYKAPRLEAGNAETLSQLRPLRPGDKLGITEDGRPIIVNEDGGVSATKLSAVPDPRVLGRWMNVPTLVNGRRVSEDEARRIIIENGFFDPETGKAVETFRSVDEAVTRSLEIAKQRNNDPAVVKAMQELRRRGVLPGR